MATPHNQAGTNEIAESILLPGDPLRAQFIAEHFLEDVKQFNSVRNMLGFTGTYGGKRISVMGTGMGCPSIGIYTYELIHFYGVKNLIRVGSCGSIQESLKVGELVMAMGASTDGNFAHQYRLPGTYSATASYELLECAVRSAREHGYSCQVGNILSSDLFYTETPEWKEWAKMGILSIEMESYALYCNANRAGVRALGIFTVSDSIVTGEGLSAAERQTGFTNMMQVALETAAAFTE
ncbi:purine-nucleoside phosphorylase [Fusibacillus kribbianus]|uniref:Purine nucleoside phosphorylase DeoD-type n=1 Tax=Fusibacillus kribbianus TaxID=3044208 RepID=A0AAP4BDV9_9FIRM|nr:purine-nucleoside phosphorylase [Ruminococcus sp. YH-rum2234]MDI9242569.1 purine-nucleoside phosphorylase [Ruminococcus sp. YH-rum2234]